MTANFPKIIILIYLLSISYLCGAVECRIEKLSSDSAKVVASNDGNDKLIASKSRFFNGSSDGHSFSMPEFFTIGSGLASGETLTKTIKIPYRGLPSYFDALFVHPDGMRAPCWELSPGTIYKDAGEVLEAYKSVYGSGPANSSKECTSLDMRLRMVGSMAAPPPSSAPPIRSQGTAPDAQVQQLRIQMEQQQKQNAMARTITLMELIVSSVEADCIGFDDAGTIIKGP